MPAEPYIPIYQPDLGGNERAYVDECLASTWISSKGSFIPRFEAAFAQFSGTGFAASVSNGTVALHVALAALGIGPGDEVIVPTLTYIASVNAIRYTGATPVFCDSEPHGWQACPDSVRAAITPRTRAIMVVHLYGGASDMASIQAIAREHGLLIVEDCAEAIGTTLDGRHVGSFGDIAAFSFFGNKTISTGEGGIVTTHDAALHQRVVHLKGQGLAPNREYWHDTIGYNYRMTNICAAIGVAQLERVDQFLAGKQRVAEGYRRRLAGLPVDFQGAAPNCRHSQWMVSIAVEDRVQRDPLRQHLAADGIETRPLFFPVHTMPMYTDGVASFPVAEDIAARGINLPSWPGLSETQLDRIAGSIGEFLA